MDCVSSIPASWRASLLAAVFVAAGAGQAAASSKIMGAPIGERPVVIESTEPKGYRPLDVTEVGGPFTMLDHNGRTVTQDSFPGKWLVITFGFPGCRESCPIALDSLSKALDVLGPDADKVQTLFVDISRDRKPDIKAMGQFLSNFHESILGLSGTRLQVGEIVRNFKVRREYAHVFVSDKETGPRIDHSTYIFVVAPGGKTRTLFYHDLPGEKMAETIRATMAQGG